MKPLTTTRRALILAMSLGALPGFGADVSWDGNGDGTFWQDNINWFGNVMPSPADTVHVGNLASVHPGYVIMSAGDTIAGLNVTSGRIVNTNGHTLLVNGNTYLSGYETHEDDGLTVGYRSGLLVERGMGSDDFDTDNLTVADMARVLLDGGIVEVDNQLTVHHNAQVKGDGIINLVQGNGTVYINDGLLDAGTDGLTINSHGTGLIDLDGSGGNGAVHATVSLPDGSAADHLTINAHGLTDAFNGEMKIAANGYIDMNLNTGWTLGNGGLIRFLGNESHPGAADLRGMPLTIQGNVDVLGGNAHGRFECHVDAQNGSVFTVGNGGHLQFAGDYNTFEGATFNLDEGAHVEVFNDITVDSATMNFESATDTVEFVGNTTYSYQTQITSNGVIQQTGDATVIGAMVVNGGIFDMDGRQGDSIINLGNAANPGSLTLNVDKIDNLSNVFDGTINTADAGLNGGLFVNQTGTDFWTMAGTLNLAGAGNLFNPTRIGGTSKMHVAGTVNLATNDRVRIAADMQLHNGSTLNMQGDNSRLTLAAHTQIDAGAAINGTGTLINTGTIQLADGVDTQDVRLINNGTLIVGNSPGSAIAPEYQQSDAGAWQVEIGGTAPGTEHDRLNVGGTATLGGHIDLTLIDGYAPALLDEVTVLSSFSRLGTFDTVGGVQYAPGLGLAVTYTATDVLVTATVMGDLDLDGDVDDADLGTAFANYSGASGSGAGWAQGDTDGDGDVDDADLGSMFANYSGALSPMAAAVPEPASLAILGLAGVMVLRRRRA